MNEAFAPFRRRIDPAVEPAFRLGRLRVSPATLEVASDAGVETLEPRVMQVLVALWRNADEAVTRDDLSQLCWGGLIVGDDALNRSISRLRKVLAADPAVAIDTIPRIGYRLRIDSAADPEAPAARPWRRLHLAIAAVAAAAALAAATWFWIAAADPRWSAVGMRPLTREPGTESYPALSPNGEWLAYAGGGGFGRPRDIRLQGVGVGEGAPLALTATPADELAPAWSPDGRRLAFVRRVPGQPCTIVVMSPPRGAERIAARCRTDESTMLSWLGSDALVISDRLGADTPRRLFVADIGSGALRPLTDPPARATGDAGATVSPDGRRIAFRRTAALGADDLYVLDRDGGAVRALTRDGFKAAGLAWSADSRTLFISTNRGGDFGLWALDAVGRRAPQRVSLGLAAFSQMSADRHGRLAVQLSKVRANLTALAPDGTATTLTDGMGIDWDPALAPDGSLAFVSELSGPAEIWVKRPGAGAVRLTNLRGSYAYAPRWSPDGRRIAFIAVARQQSDIYVVDADGGRLRRVTTDGAAKGSVGWGAGTDELLYTVRTNAGWRLMRMAGDTARPVPGAADAIVLRHAPDGVLYVRRASDSRLARLGPDDRLRPLNVAAPDREAWEVTAAGIYAVDGNSLRFTPWSGPGRRVGDASAASRPNFAVSADGVVIQPRLAQDDADLMLIELKRD